MNRTLRSLVQEELCPEGIWTLTDAMRSRLRCQISRLPRKKVSEDETRYPQTPAGMRAFSVKFFTRHYFQTQNCLIDYMTSQHFLEILRSGHLQILDVGSGPAVTSLAITDMLACILKNLGNTNNCLGTVNVKINYILNDTSGICLGTGQHMLTDYFRICGPHNHGIMLGKIFAIQKAFPDNMNQLRRIKLNLGSYDITTLSYVVSPLKEETSLRSLLKGLLNIESFCSREGRILILQDRFQAALMKQIGRALGTESQEEESTQEVYPKRKTNDTYTYSYYRCLYAPTNSEDIPQISVA